MINYDDFYSNHDFKHRYSDKYFVKYILKKNDIYNCRILDIGCGSGRLSKWLSLNNNIVDGINMSEVGIKIAKNKCNNNGSFFTEDFLKFRPNTIYDVLFIYNFSLFNVDNISKQIASRIKSITNKSGIIIFIYSTDGSMEIKSDWLNNKPIFFRDYFLYHNFIIYEEKYLKARLLPFFSFIINPISKFMYSLGLPIDYLLILKKP